MACSTPYDEMMSLKLDGLLDADDEQLLQAHIEECTDCALVWSAMQQADMLLFASVTAPVTLSVGFETRVMSKIAAIPLYRPQYGEAVAAVEIATPSLAAVPTWDAVLPAFTMAAQHATLSDAELLQEWQKRLGQYAKIAAGVGLSIAGTAGLVIGLIMTGVLKASGPVADWVAMLRTFFSALSTWVLSVFANIGGGAVAGVALVNNKKIMTKSKKR